MFEIVFLSKAELASGVWRLDFEPSRPIDYVPGQYSHLALSSMPHERARAFSWVSHPSQTTLSFITRFDSPASDYKQALFALEPGDSCYIDEPMGDAVLPRLATTPLVFVAQGIALASYISILTECARSNLAHSVTLFWARRDEDNSLEKLIPGKVPNLTRQDILYPERLSANDILTHMLPTSLLYLSGSQVFVETLGAELEVAGLLRERIIYDYYEGYASL
jgi:ferredoxin-NADP reductase